MLKTRIAACSAPRLPRAGDSPSAVRAGRRLRLHAGRGREDLFRHPRARPPDREQGPADVAAPDPGAATCPVRRAADRRPVDFLPGRFAIGRGKRLARISRPSVRTAADSPAWRELWFSAASEAGSLDFLAVHPIAKPAMGFSVDRIIDGLNRAVAEGHVKTGGMLCCRSSRTPRLRGYLDREGNRYCPSEQCLYQIPHISNCCRRRPCR